MARRKTSPAPEENTIEPAALRVQTAPASQARLQLDDERTVENGIQAERDNASAAASTKRTPSAPAGAPDAPPRDTTSLPAGVRDRFLQVGEKWFFPNGDPAFRDLGQKLSTRSENAEIVRSLVEIAQARGWDEITVGGTKDFKRAAWHEAALQKIAVRGYTPTEIDEARLVRAMARRAESAREGTAPERPTEPAERAGDSGRDQKRTDSPAPGAAATADQKKVTYGVLVAHGHENYHFDPHEDMSYYVTLKTKGGREVPVWGKDLERAMRESKSQPKVGDRIGVWHRGEEAVTVPKQERDGSGKVVREYELQTHRNSWTVESEQFFKDRAKLAEVVRDPSVDPRRVVETNPELAGTYVALNGAKLIAQRRFADQHDQARFVDTMRKTLAREIKRGEPLYAPTMRDRPRADERTQLSPAAPEMTPLR